MTSHTASKPTLHLISQAHLDPVWLWPWRDGFAEVLTTLQSAVDRLHTMLHGYLQAVCDDEGIAYKKKAMMSGLFSVIRSQHPAFADLGPREDEILQVLRRVNLAGATVVVASHDHDLALRFADRIVVLEHGKVRSDQRLRSAKSYVL